MQMSPSHMLLAKRAHAYISLSLGLVVVVGFGTGDLGGRAGVHFVLQLCDLVRQLLQGLHNVGSLLRFHPSVLLQAVYQGLNKGCSEREGVNDRKRNGKDEKKEVALRLILPSDTQSASAASLASSFSCPAGVLMPPK